MKGKKRGKWTDKEMRTLVLLRRDGLTADQIARKLKKSRKVVKAMLEKLGPDLFNWTIVEGPQKLPPWLRDSLLNFRLISIWQGLMHSEMTSGWRDALAAKPEEIWLSKVSECIPDNVKDILGGLRPPTIHELEALTPITSNEAGVYMRIMRSRFDSPIAEDAFIYVGSASKRHAGLTGRMLEHTMKKKRRKRPKLQTLVQNNHLGWPGGFVVLIAMKMDDPSVEAVLNGLIIVTLIESILTIWLCAIQLPHSLESLCPWDSKLLPYKGTCSHNPLEIDVVQPVECGSEEQKLG